MREIKQEARKLKELDILENRRRLANMKSRKFESYVKSYDRKSEILNKQKETTQRYLHLMTNEDMLSLRKQQDMLKQLKSLTSRSGPKLILPICGARNSVPNNDN